MGCLSNNHQKEMHHDRPPPRPNSRPVVTPPQKYLELRDKLQADLAAWDAQGKPCATQAAIAPQSQPKAVTRPAAGTMAERVLYALERGHLAGKPDTWRGVSHMSRNVITKQIGSLRRHGYAIKTIKYGRDFGYQLECF